MQQQYSKQQDRKVRHENGTIEKNTTTHTSDFIKKKILEVIHRRGCLQIVVAALHAIIGYPTDVPKLSVVVDNNLIPPNLYFRR